MLERTTSEGAATRYTSCRARFLKRAIPAVTTLSRGHGTQVAGHVPQNFDASNLIKSRTRHEYPHSLSYQASTFTHLSPTTLV
jgi:hypothetical protein